jgi:hypothetical protein
MASYLDFFADFAVSGRIAGVGLGSRPGDWPKALGDRYFEASWNSGHLVRQFGFIDANFGDGSGEWICDLIQVTPPKVDQFDNMVPDVIGAGYGSFPARVPFGDVAELVAGAGAEVHHVPRVNEASLETYWVPDGKVMFWLISAGQAAEYPDLRIGDVWSASTAANVDIPADRRVRYR